MIIERALIGIDFSEQSVTGARWVARHFAPDAELLLLHAVFVPEPPRFLRGRFPSPQGLVETARNGAEKRLQDLARGDSRIHTAVRSGRVAEQLVRCAEEVRADLIVVGKHGKRSGVWDWLGSTAEQVLLASGVPVLLAAGMGDGPPRRLLVALDEGDVTPAVLRWARTLAEQFGSRVTALHAVRSLPATSALAMATVGSGTTAFAPELHDAELRWGADRWMERMLEAGFDPERTRSEVTFGEPEYEIVRTAERFGCDLIVMGNRRPGGMARTMLGSVVRGVLRRAPCPTLVVGAPRAEPSA